MSASTAVYCVQNDISNRLSAGGITLRVDDTPPTTLGDVIDDASAEVEMYCLLHYTSAQLTASRWIKHKCADIATYLLCERRGNPAPLGIANKYERAMGELQRIQAGSLKIADVPQRRNAVPMVSNMRPMLRPYPHVVTEPARSTDQVDQIPKKNRDPIDQFTVLPDIA